MQNKAFVIYILLFSLILSGCGAGQVIGPTFTPTPTLTSTSTLTPTLTPTLTQTLTPTLTPTVESFDLPCETDLSNWREYPSVSDLIAMIHSGKVAQSLHDQHVFEKLMQEKGVAHPFNPDTMIKPDWEVSKQSVWDTFYYGFGKSYSTASNNPEARNMWPVCGFLTTEQGFDMIVWAQALPSTELPEGYVYQFIAQGTPDESVNPSERDAWVSKILGQVNGSAGGYFTTYYNWTGDMRKAVTWVGNKMNETWSMLPAAQDRVGYEQSEDAPILTWKLTGFAPQAIETLVRTGDIQAWGR